MISLIIPPNKTHTMLSNNSKKDTNKKSSKVKKGKNIELIIKINRKHDTMSKESAIR